MGRLHILSHGTFNVGCTTLHFYSNILEIQRSSSFLQILRPVWVNITSFISKPMFFFIKHLWRNSVICLCSTNTKAWMNYYQSSVIESIWTSLVTVHVINSVYKNAGALCFSQCPSQHVHCEHARCRLSHILKALSKQITPLTPIQQSNSVHVYEHLILQTVNQAR